MREYLFQCRACRNTFTTFSREDVPPCPICGNPSVHRRYEYQTRPSTPEHFNVSAGQYVTNNRELKDAFARRSDEESDRTGIEQRLEYLTPAEMRDPTVHGVTEEGLDTQERTWHDLQP